MIRIKNIALPKKLRRSTRKEKVRRHKKIIDDSIELRPESVELREEFGTGKSIRYWAENAKMSLAL